MRICSRKAAAILLTSTFFALLTAQRGFRGGGTGAEPPPAPRLGYDGRFTFARLRYIGYFGSFYYRGIPSWQHGYNTAEHNLLSIMHEVTSVHPRMDSTAVVGIDDPELFRYPVTYMTEAGYWELTDREAATLSKYLLKGGFLILDDSRDGMSPGNAGWANIEANFRKIVPDARFVDLKPSHPIFHSFFDIESFDIVKQFYDRGRPEFRAIFDGNDPTHRMMVLSNFNTDVSNYWEFSAVGFRPVDESNEAYKLGVNYLIYALTH
jgi:hypothetical protein